MVKRRAVYLMVLVGAVLVWALAAVHPGAAFGEPLAAQPYEGSAEQKA